MSHGDIAEQYSALHSRFLTLDGASESSSTESILQFLCGRLLLADSID